MNTYLRQIIIFLSISFAISNASAQDGWILRNSETTTRLNSISSSDGQNVVAVGQNSAVTVSHTGGITWQVLDNFAHGQNTQGKNLTGVAAISGHIFCVVGSVDSIYRSTDKGDTWIGNGLEIGGCKNFDGHALPLSAIDFDSITGVSVAAGPNGEVAFSSDSGKHWEENPPNSDFGLGCVSIHNGSVLAGDGGWGRVFISDDQGDRWGAYWVGKNVTFSGCDNEGWILVGGAGMVYHSSTKGFSWDSLGIGTTENLNAVHFGNIVRGYIVGDHGSIFMTTDGGYTWVKQHSPTTQNLRSIHMSDPFHGFICGDSGVILTTQNGGYFDTVTRHVDPSPQSASGIRTYPNPFSSKTTIEVLIPLQGHVRLSIFNMLGEEVAVLANGAFESGVKTFEWNAGDAPSGVYLCKCEIDGQVISSQITLEK